MWLFTPRCLLQITAAEEGRLPAHHAMG